MVTLFRGRNNDYPERIERLPIGREEWSFYRSMSIAFANELARAACSVANQKS